MTALFIGLTLMLLLLQFVMLRAMMDAPDVIIRDGTPPYIRRWHLIPRNRFFNLYLHQIQRNDIDRALHDHPWWNLSIVLRGSYREITPSGQTLRRAGSFVLRRASALHRLEVEPGFAWTLFVTGPVIRDWGFACPQGWVHWKDFVDPARPGEIGKGCDQ